MFIYANRIYFNIENLVLWARSEKIGCAVNIFHYSMCEAETQDLNKLLNYQYVVENQSRMIAII